MVFFLYEAFWLQSAGTLRQSSPSGYVQIGQAKAAGFVVADQIRLILHDTP
jgi:hypothetical protein